MPQFGRNTAYAAVALTTLLGTAACDPPADPSDAPVDEIKSFFQAQNKTVVTFVGYSAAGYEDPAAMLEEAGLILDEHDPSSTIVNIGATPDGIGAVYEMAKRRGFTTTGIVSTRAKAYEAPISPFVDRVFYVEDETWGGFMDDGEHLSPTSTAMVEVSDLLVGIGGGEVGRDELVAARRLGKQVRFVHADMNHQNALEKTQQRGLPPPADFRGAAGRELAGPETFETN